MASAREIKFVDLLIEVKFTTAFAKPCGFRSKGFNRTSSVVERAIPDCDDEGAAVWVRREIDTLSSEISASGVVDRDDLDGWDAWFEDGLSREVRVTVVGTAAANGRTYTGDYVLASLTWTAERKNSSTNEITLQSDGPLVRVDAVA